MFLPCSKRVPPCSMNQRWNMEHTVEHTQYGCDQWERMEHVPRHLHPRKNIPPGAPWCSCQYRAGQGITTPTIGGTTAMDLSTPSPGYNTSPEERLTAFLIKDLQRHFPDHEEMMKPYAQLLARQVTRYARRLELED